MLGPVELSHSSQESVHAVLSRDLGGFREVVNFLVAREPLVNLGLNVAARPHHSEILVAFGRFSEAIILQEVPDKPDFDLVVQLEIVPPILGLVGPDTYWVYVGAETDVLLPLPVLESGWLLNYTVNLSAMPFVLLWLFFILTGGLVFLLGGRTLNINSTSPASILLTSRFLRFLNQSTTAGKAITPAVTGRVHVGLIFPNSYGVLFVDGDQLFGLRERRLVSVLVEDVYNVIEIIVHHF